MKAPLIDEYYANLACKVVDARVVAKYNFFILEVQNAWIALSTKPPGTIHHLGKRDVHGCRQNDQVAVEDQAAYVVKNEISVVRFVRLPRLLTD